jgi:broad specificity phosphatase PhoE
MSGGSSRIVLVRHGRSAHVQTGWLDSEGIRKWRDAYEAAGIAADDRPPVNLIDLVAAADVVVSSDARRAIESARALAPGREIEISPLLRELDLESPELGPVSLPFRAWAFAIGGRMAMKMLHGAYPSSGESKRIEDAAAWLIDLAEREGVVVAVTHASFRDLLAKKLRDGGWNVDAGRRTRAHWSVVALTRAGSESV